MSNRPTAAYGLAQMLASDPEMATRIKAWMEANPDAMDRRKQRKLLRDLEAAEALLCAQAEVEPEAVEGAVSDVGPGLPGHEIPRDANEAIDDEIACDAEADGGLAIEHGFMSGPPAPEGRTYGEAATDADGTAIGIKPMHGHAWVLWCAAMAWFETASRFAALAVIGAAVALVGDVRAVWAWIRKRDKSRPRKRFLLATALRPVCVWGVGIGLMTTARFTGRRAADGARICTAVVVFGRGPPLDRPCCGCDPASWAGLCYPGQRVKAAGRVMG